MGGRKRLKREINEMNEAFKEEILEMEAEQKAAAELEECYFDDDIELVPNTHKRDSLDGKNFYLLYWDGSKGVAQIFSHKKKKKNNWDICVISTTRLYS